MRKGSSERTIVHEEGLALSRHIRNGDIAVPLDRTGKEFDSLQLAAWLEGLGRDLGGTICFLIGGPLGHGEDVMQKAKKVLSLSRLTLTHEMARLVLLEQLYRASTIMAGEKYHK
jgi:23S rRNA (pseudouridine1915-N3)-methyltransferase